MNLETTYKNKKIFLTGHTGFKGSWLLAWLHQLGATVKGYALPPENKIDLYNQIDGDSLCETVFSDIRDKQRLKYELLNFQPDFVFHLAAQPLVLQSYTIPVDTFEINTLGTAYVLEAVRYLDKPCNVVVITTDKVYENKEWQYPYRENDRLGGYDPYSASKAAAEIVVNAYRNSYFNFDQFENHQKAIATARAGNVIGGGDWAKNRIIPDIIRALQANRSIEIRNPDSIRPWQHVLEPINGYLTLGGRLAENPNKYAGSWNFGPGENGSFNVETLVQKTIKLWGCGNYHIPNRTKQLHEAGLLKLDINKSIHDLGWKPKWNSDITLQKTIDFYKYASINPLGFMIKQIQELQTN